MHTVALPTKLVTDKECIETWLNVMESVILRPMFEMEHPNIDTNNDDKIRKYSWWKAKHYAVKILQRMYSRYGNPSLNVKGDRMKEFSI